MTSSKYRFSVIILYIYIIHCGVALPIISVFKADPPHCRNYRDINTYYLCSDNLKFNEKIQACDLPQNVDRSCNKPNTTITNDSSYNTDNPPLPLSLNDPECANVKLSYHPHPFDCSNFTVSHDNKKWYLKCPEEFHFDKNSQMCKPQAFSLCFVDSRCRMDVDFLPHPTDCASYIECYFNISYAQKCPDDKWFYSQKNECTWPSESDCLVTEPPWASPELNCAPSNKIDRSSYGCRFYLQCESWYQGTLKACPDGTAYSSNNQLCSASNLEQCTDYGHIVAAWTPPPTSAPAPLSYDFPGCTKNGKLIPHPTNQSKFIECVEHRAFERNCPDNLNFYTFHCY